MGISREVHKFIPLTVGEQCDILVGKWKGNEVEIKNDLIAFAGDIIGIRFSPSFGK